jgi:hypothetical protein
LPYGGTRWRRRRSAHPGLGDRGRPCQQAGQRARVLVARHRSRPCPSERPDRAHDFREACPCAAQPTLRLGASGTVGAAVLSAVLLGASLPAEHRERRGTADGHECEPEQHRRGRAQVERGGHDDERANADHFGDRQLRVSAEKIHEAKAMTKLTTARTPVRPTETASAAGVPSISSASPTTRTTGAGGAAACPAGRPRRARSRPTPRLSAASPVNAPCHGELRPRCTTPSR